MPPARLDCRRCRHYAVTWDERFPHGCRAMGFKSARYPADEVLSATGGEPCRLYEPKTPTPPRPPQGGVRRI